MLNSYSEDIYESRVVTNDELKAALAITIDEIKTECAIYSSLSKPSKHNLPGEYKNFIGTDFDKAIYRNLLTAVTGTSSNFENNPKKTCLELSIGICLKMPFQEQQNFEQGSQHIPPLTDENKAALQLLAKLIAPYTDKDLFYMTTDMDILKIRSLLTKATQAIPLFNKIRSVVNTSYEQALQDTAILQLKLNDEATQDNESNKDSINSLNTLLSELRRAEKGDAPVVFMKRITYPSNVAVCTCGNESCGAQYDAKDMLRARVVANSNLDYMEAFQKVFNRFRNSAGFESNMIIHNAGIVIPFVCPECKAVNIASESFIYAFKLCVLNRWIQSPPSQRNKDAILTYSASVIIDGITAILQNNQELVQETLQGYKPQIAAEKVEVKIPEYSLADLVSSETYTTYMSMLSVHSNSRHLQDSQTRKQLFLQYMLSTLHIATVDSSPSSVIESILSFSRFSKYRESMEKASETIYELTANLERANLLQKVITSEYYKQPINGYVDMVLSDDFILPLLDRLPDVGIKECLKSDTQTAVNKLLEYISDTEKELEDTRKLVTAEIDALAHDLLLYEQSLYGSELQGNGVPAPLAGDKQIELTLSKPPKTAEDSYIYKCEVCNLIWAHISDMYLLLMYQTIVHYSSILEHNPMIFGGLFTTKPKDMEKAAVKLCSSLGVDMKFSNVADYRTLFSEVLYACLEADSTSRLMNVLNISEGRLLRSYAVPLPSNQYLSTLITYSVLNEVDFPADLSLFAQGADISDYQHEVQSIYQDELETGISATESLAIAECAAFFYITFSPIDTNKSQLQEQLGGSKFVDSFEL